METEFLNYDLTVLGRHCLFCHEMGHPAKLVINSLTLLFVFHNLKIFSGTTLSTDLRDVTVSYYVTGQEISDYF